MLTHFHDAMPRKNTAIGELHRDNKKSLSGQHTRSGCRHWWKRLSASYTTRMRRFAEDERIIGTIHSRQRSKVRGPRFTPAHATSGKTYVSRVGGEMRSAAVKPIFTRWWSIVFTQFRTQFAFCFFTRDHSYCEIFTVTHKYRLKMENDHTNKHFAIIS